MKKVLWLLLAAVLALGVAACGDDLDESNDSGSTSTESDGGGEGAKPAVTVGSANIPENVVLAEIYDTDRLLTTDERDFRSVTRGDGSPFRLLPADA